MKAIEAGLNASEYRLRLRQNIKDMGLTTAFVDGGLVVLFSGPSKAVVKRIGAGFLNNWFHSRDQARDLGGKRIGDTETGKFLEAVDLEIYFIDFYGKRKKPRENASFSVWCLASREFMKARFREVATAVCGADPKRVFRKVEVKWLLKNRQVELINKRPIQLFRDFHAIDAYEAFRLFCLTELLESKKHATAVNTPEAWRSYRERRMFFIVERQETIENAPAMTPDEVAEIKQRKLRILTAYSLKSAIAIMSGAVSTPSIPAALPHSKRKKMRHGLS